MKSLLKFIIFVGLTFIATKVNASEEQKHNIKLEFGTNIQTDMKTNGYVRRTNSPVNFGFGISKTFDDLHLGFSTYHNVLKAQGHRKGTLYTQEFNIHALFLNGEYDIYKGEKITPFLTVGTGISYNKTDAYIGLGANNGIYVGKKRVTPAYNAGAGIRINIDDNHKLLIGYKYYNLGLAKTSNTVLAADKTLTGDNIKTKLTHHSVFVGLVLHF